MFDNFDIENYRDYHVGGFCPIELGDCIASRFTVLQKLGYGGYGTVWLVRDDEQRHGRYVALKVVAADASQDSGATTAVVDRLRQFEHDNQLPNLFVTELERCFHTSRNGRHLCQVFPVLGPPLDRLNNDYYYRLYPSFPKPFASRLAHALDAMHTLGICHGDLTLGNVALRLEQSLDDLSEADLDAIFGPPRKERIDMLFPDAPSPAPSHLVRPVNLGWLPASYLSAQVCLLDFDAAFFTQDPPNELPCIPVDCLAPEAIFSLRNGPAADVWAFGCILFGLRRTWTPFLSLMGGSPLSTVLSMERLLGSLPQGWTSFPFRDGYPVHGPLEPDISYSTVEDFRKTRLDSLEEIVSGILEPRMPPAAAAVQDGVDKFCLTVPRIDRNYSQETFDAEYLSPIDKDDAALFADLLRRIFTYDDQSRLTARQVLEHPWLKEANQESGGPDVQPN